MLSIVTAIVAYIIALFVFRAIKREDIMQMPKGNKILKLLEKRKLIR